MRTIVEPGDFFIDDDGLAWVGVWGGNKESNEALFVWFTPKAKGETPSTLTRYLEETDKEHPESDANIRIPIEILRQPFRLVAELNDEEKWS